MPEREPLTFEEATTADIAQRMRDEPTYLQRNPMVGATPPPVSPPAGGGMADWRILPPGTRQMNPDEWFLETSQAGAQPELIPPARPLSEHVRPPRPLLPEREREAAVPFHLTTPVLPPGTAQDALTSLIGPEAMARRVQELEQRQRTLDQYYDSSQEGYQKWLAMREKIDAQVNQALQDYEKGLQEAPPAAPALRPVASVPDLKIRPFLDPTGKDALLNIAQGLSALAVTIGGAVQKAPQTAIKQYREMVDLWRQDQLDNAESKWREFQASVEQIRTDNASALKLYEIEDRRYGLNQTAKHAAYLASLKRAELHDKFLETSMLPLKLAIEQQKMQLDQGNKMFENLVKFSEVERKWQDALDGVPKSYGGIIGKLSGVNHALATAPPGPEREKLEAQRDVLQQAKQMHDDAAVTRAQAYTGIRVAGTQLPKLDDRLRQLDSFVGDLQRLDSAVEYLSNAGMLPNTPTPFDEWKQTWRRWVPSTFKDPKIEANIQVVKLLVPELLTTYARNVENMIGPRHREAFAIPNHPSLLTVNQLRALVHVWGSGAERARPLYQERKKLLLELLPGVSPPIPGEPAEAEEPEEKE